MNGEERDALAEVLSQRHSPTSAGSILRANLYSDYDELAEALRDELYEKPRRKTRHGTATMSRTTSPLVRSTLEIIATRHLLHKPTLIVTTNFDNLLESAIEGDPSTRRLMAAAGIKRAMPIYKDYKRRLGQSTLPIYHIHGYVSVNQEPEPEHKIVLTERDYGISWEKHWSFDLLEPFMSAQWAFIGMSFQDSHISFLLAERQRRLKGAAKNPIGIFSLQGYPWATLSDNVKSFLAKMEATRLSELGMNAVRTYYYFQDTQILQEAVLKMRDVGALESYPERRERWKRSTSENIVSADDGEFRDPAYVEALHECLLWIRSELEGRKERVSDERFKVELWVRTLKGRALCRWASSEFVVRSIRQAPEFDLATTLPIAAVEGFTTGAPCMISAKEADRKRLAQDYWPSQWKRFLSVPIVLGGPPWYYLPVGVLVVGSDVSGDGGMLGDKTRAIPRGLDSWLERLRALLDPRAVDMSCEPA